MGVFDDIQPVELPGPATITLDEGASTVYFDRDAALDPPPRLLQSRLSITGPDGAAIATDITGTDLSLRTPSRDLVAVLDFDAPATGEYTFAVDGAVGLPPGRLAIGPRFLSAAWRAIAAIVAGAILAIGGLVGFAISLSRGAASRRSPTAPPSPASTGGWGGKSGAGGWGNADTEDTGTDDAMWGDAQQWSDPFDRATPKPASGPDDGPGYGRTEGDDTWREQETTESHDDGMPPPPKSF
jgi:hypothetical protein